MVRLLLGILHYLLLFLLCWFWIVALVAGLLCIVTGDDDFAGFIVLYCLFVFVVIVLTWMFVCYCLKCLLGDLI